MQGKHEFENLIADMEGSRMASPSRQVSPKEAVVTKLTTTVVAWVLMISAAAFWFVGATANDLILMAMGGVLMVGWAVFELRHPVNHRRTLAAWSNLWGIPIALAFLALSWFMR